MDVNEIHIPSGTWAVQGRILKQEVVAVARLVFD